MFSFGKMMGSLVAFWATSSQSQKNDGSIFYEYYGSDAYYKNNSDILRRTLLLKNTTGDSFYKWYPALPQGSFQQAYFPFTANYDICINNHHNDGINITNTSSSCYEYDGSLKITSLENGKLYVTSEDNTAKYCWGTSTWESFFIYAPADDSYCDRDPNKNGLSLSLRNGAKDSIYILQITQTCFYDNEDDIAVSCRTTLPYRAVQLTQTHSKGFVLPYQICSASLGGVIYNEKGIPSCANGAWIGEMVLTVANGVIINGYEYPDNICRKSNYDREDCYEYTNLIYPANPHKSCKKFDPCENWDPTWWDTLSLGEKIGLFVAIFILASIGGIGTIRMCLKCLDYYCPSSDTEERRSSIADRISLFVFGNNRMSESQLGTSLTRDTDDEEKSSTSCCVIS